MTHWEFPGSDPIELDISLIAADISVTGLPTDVITVSLEPTKPGRAGDEAVAAVRVEYSAGRLEIVQPKQSGFIRRHSTGFSLAVTVPAGSRCTVSSAAADVSCHGELGSLDVRNASGDVSAATITGPVQVHTLSGQVRLDEAAAEVTAHSGSGDICLRRAGGNVIAQTASGDIEIGTAAASATARTASGSVRIASICAGTADITTVSGDVYVGVAPGVGVYLDLGTVTGRATSDLEPSDSGGDAELHIKGRTLSGSLNVARAALADGHR